MTSTARQRPFAGLGAKLAQVGGVRFALKEQVSFAKRLSFLMNAGVPLIEGLGILLSQARGRGQNRVLTSVLRDVTNGQTLSRAFGKFPRVFGEFTISIAQVGESSGTLALSLDYLADELKKKQVLQRKVIGAFVYPAVIFFATIAITGFLILYLFPKITPIFASLHTTLPLSTRIVMAMSTFLQHWGLVLVVGVVLFVMALGYLLRKSLIVRYYFHAFTLRVPLVGSVLRNYNVANGMRTLSLLLKSGVSLSNALPIVANTTQNLVYKAHYAALGAVVSRGDRISVYFHKHSRHFPDVLGHMVAVGERSGTLSETLSYLAQLYEHEVDEFTKNLSTLIEPALMVVMGVMVGFIAISIITPIYGITQSLNSH